MSQFYHIHPENPQHRLLAHAADIIRGGGVIAYPTDSAYALGCHIGDKAALQRIRRIRKLDNKHNFTLMCRDLSELANYAKVGNSVFRTLKQLTPGPYTFVLPATREVPRRLSHAKRKTIGLRVPDNCVAQGLLHELNEPLMSVSLIMPGDEYPLTDPYDMRERLEHEVDLVIDGEFCGLEPTTVVEFVDEIPNVLHAGKGAVDVFD